MGQWDDTPVTNPNRKDPEFRFGLLMREVAELRTKYEELLETVIDQRQQLEMFQRMQRASIRPQQIRTAGVSIFVAAIVTGIVQGLMRVFGGMLPH